MKLLRTCLTAALVMLIASALAAAQDKKSKAGKRPAPPRSIASAVSWSG